MNQNEQPNSSPTTPEPFTQFRIKTYPAMPVPLNVGERPAEEWDILDIRVVGIGQEGSRLVQLLSGNLAGVTCHEIIPAPEQESSGDIAALLSSVRSCDLLFIVTEFDDDYCESIAHAVGHASCEAVVLTLVVTSPTGMIPHQCNDGTGKWHDTMFSVSDDSLPICEESAPAAPEGVFVAAITSLVTHRTCIGVDFNDVIRIMHEGSSGKIGIGIATGTDNASIAASRAIEHLRTQGVDISTARGVLAVVHGSSELAMDDFDSASMVIHKHISPDTNILIGLDKRHVGQGVKVTILTVH